MIFRLRRLYFRLELPNLIEYWVGMYVDLCTYWWSSGVGKSTLTLQIAKSEPNLSILYCAGEESVMQIKHRATNRDHLRKTLLINETRIEAIIEQAQKLQPDLLIVDSIQTVYRDEVVCQVGSSGKRVCRITSTVGQKIQFVNYDNWPYH